MIRITVELISANTGKTTLLGTAEICNDGQHPQPVTFGNYDAKFYVHRTRSGKPLLWRKGRVESMHRQKRGCWDLLQLALDHALGSRNKAKP